jgi:hypothetical protein
LKVVLCLASLVIPSIQFIECISGQQQLLLVLYTRATTVRNQKTGNKKCQKGKEARNRQKIAFRKDDLGLPCCIYTSMCVFNLITEALQTHKASRLLKGNPATRDHVSKARGINGIFLHLYRIDSDF